MMGIASFTLFRLAYIRSSALGRVGLIFFGLLLATPAILFASNYVLLIPYALWFYEFHAMPGAEITAGLAAAILGVMYASAKLRPSKLNTPILVICTVLVFALLVTPFAKQLFYAVDYTSLDNKWKDGICIQTSSYTCVPACVATLARLQEMHLTEPELAQAAGTTKRGTEYWYLARALRHKGYEPELHHVRSIKDAPVPSVVGVNLGDIGHVVVLLSKDKYGVNIGEPLRGRCHYSWLVFNRCYKPDGMCITINKLDKRNKANK